MDDIDIGIKAGQTCARQKRKSYGKVGNQYNNRDKSMN